MAVSLGFPQRTRVEETALVQVSFFRKRPREQDWGSGRSETGEEEKDNEMEDVLRSLLLCWQLRGSPTGIPTIQGQERGVFRHRLLCFIDQGLARALSFTLCNTVIYK